MVVTGCPVSLSAAPPLIDALDGRPYRQCGIIILVLVVNIGLMVHKGSHDWDMTVERAEKVISVQLICGSLDQPYNTSSILPLEAALPVDCRKSHTDLAI